MKNLFLLEIDCDWTEQRCQEALQKLPPEVQQRAQRYRNPQARSCLLATQIALRSLLRELSIDENKLAVCEKGRPFLQGGPLQFNLSHSEKRGVLALAKDSTLINGLGVDIEWTNRSVNRSALAKRFFTPRESREAQSSKLGFFRIWTRKEAVLKTNGIGLRVPLDSFEVLEDQVGENVTGRPVQLGTSQRPGNYLISWAVASDWGSYSTHWFHSSQNDWLATLAGGINA